MEHLDLTPPQELPDPDPAQTSSSKEVTVHSPSSCAQSDLLVAIQRRYALIKMDGRIWVLDNNSLSARSSDGTAAKLVLSNRSDGSLLLARMAMALAPEIEAAKQIRKFFIVPETTLYDGVEFNPAVTSENRLNLWIGPTVCRRRLNIDPPC